MSTHVHLRKFKTEELIFNEEETILILKFIFKNSHAVVDRTRITDKVREFAQGLLVEAVDASYAMGYVEAIFRSIANPRAGVKNILKKFGKKALKHWFKHATEKDLLEIEIYEIVRQRLEINFGRIMILHSNGIALKNIVHVSNVA